MRTHFVLVVVFALVFQWNNGFAAPNKHSNLGSTSQDTVAAIPAKLGPSFSTFTTDSFCIVHDTDNIEAQKIAQLLELTYKQFQAAFKNQGFNLQNPDDKLMWVCFSDSDRFSNYALEADGMDLSWLSGYYSAKTNIVAIIKPHKMPDGQKTGQEGTDADGSILAITSVPGRHADTVKIMHEAAHQFAFNTGLQKRRVMYPLWLSEGLAASFEGGQTSGSNDERGRRLAKMYHQGKLVPLDEFVTMTRLPTDPVIHKDIYAQAWGLFNFLSKNRTGNLKNYLADIYKLEPGWRSAQTLHCEFVSAFGSIDELDCSWQQFLRTFSAAKQ